MTHMVSELAEVLASTSFMPHGMCFLWRPDVLWLHVVSDTLIVLSYYSIPFALLVLVRKRADLAFDWIFKLFGAFIFLCGTTHLLSIVTVWVPAYWLDGALKAATAAVSVAAAILSWRLLPKLVALPSPTQLLKVNRELADALDKHEQAEAKLRKLSLALEYSSSMVIITNTQALIEYCNPAFCQGTGYTAEEVLGRKVSILGSGFTDPEIYQDLWQTISQGQAWQGEFLDRKKNGDLYWCMAYIAPVRGEEGAITHYVAVSHDISALKNSEETIRRLAFYDPLTELPNRALFKERLEQAQLHSKRDQRIFALIYLDLDRFKNINDTLGHIVGDKLLIEVARRLKAGLRGVDTVARLGGDEFAVILNNLSEVKDAAAIADSLCKALSLPYRIDGHDLFVSASLGISLYPDDHTELEQLIRMADTALYHAKDLGRDQYAFYSELPNALSVERLSLEMDLRYAIERDELQVYYQPKFEVGSERLLAVEALLRWRHPRFGLVTPDHFIALAEETGLIAAIGEWVLRTVCLHVRDWRARGIDWTVAVNLSARQFRDKNLLTMLDAILTETGVDPCWLEFEITEGALMKNPERTTALLKAMKERGFTLAIDDFGTGYSSLSYLKRFPVDALKIDRSFVCDIETDPDDRAIVKTVIVLAHALGVRVVAEGVESRAQLEFLRREGCDQAQGYYFSEPIPAEPLLARFLAVSTNKFASTMIHQSF